MLIFERQQVISITHSLTHSRTLLLLLMLLLLLRSTWGDIRDATCHMIDGINDFNEKPLVSTWSEVEWHKRERDSEMKTSGSQEMIRTCFGWGHFVVWPELYGISTGSTGSSLSKHWHSAGDIFPNSIGLRISLNKLKTITYLGRKRLSTIMGASQSKHVHCFRRKWT